ncbi:outer membrane beta-barrel protein [Candidatus Tisiphia endosymbiont of Metellina segmentata]|uniref:outer membrane beta-barrel protein n=1 Tax=Candidatus Tisiphia endosymbiont of Metellina segmentata TaxID=3066274 RepID=UPI00313AC534
MKKLFLIAATSTALLTSATSFAETGGFYLKAEGGATKLNNTKMKFEDTKSDSLKFKSKTNAILGLGAGYYAMDNVRAELTLDFLVNPEFTNNTTKDLGSKRQEVSKITAKGQVVSLLLSGYVDLYDAGFAKFFAGAGVGMAQIKEKLTANDTTTFEGKVQSTERYSDTRKPANNFAYQLTVGASANVADGVNVELAYSWRDYGETNSKNKDKKDTDKISKTAYRGHNLMAGLRFDI